MRVLAAFRRWFEASEDFVLAGSVSDVRAARSAGRMAVAFDLEGMNALDGDLDLLHLVHALGVRQILFAYNRNNLAGGGCHDEDAGLTDFGRAAVREMNDLGILVDCSHCGYRTTMDAMELSCAPVIFSHSNPRALRDHERNIRDEQATACAATGGVIGVNGIGLFLGEDDIRTEALADHVEYLLDLVGPDHVGIGLDYFFEADLDASFQDALAGNEDYWPREQYPGRANPVRGPLPAWRAHRPPPRPGPFRGRGPRRPRRQLPARRRRSLGLTPDPTTDPPPPESGPRPGFRFACPGYPATASGGSASGEIRSSCRASERRA